jgi:hypothetical protein
MLPPPSSQSPSSSSRQRYRSSVPASSLRPSRSSVAALDAASRRQKPAHAVSLATVLDRRRQKADGEKGRRLQAGAARPLLGVHGKGEQGWFVCSPPWRQLQLGCRDAKKKGAQRRAGPCGPQRAALPLPCGLRREERSGPLACARA